KQLSQTTGEWSDVNFLVKVPDEIKGENVTKIWSCAKVFNTGDDKVYLDDFVVYQYDASIDDMIETVDQLGDSGEFNNNGALHVLQAHLSSLNHFLTTGKINKLIKHLKGLQELIELEKDNNMLSD